MKKIKMFVMDVDGTLTDGKIYMGNNGEAFKAFDIKDGMGIHELLPLNGVVTVILTGRESEIVNQRARELEVKEVIQNAKDKLKSLEELVDKYHICYEEVAYIGDDIADKKAMEVCGISGCPSDAINEIRKISNYVCANPGGGGAVREFIEWLIRENKLIGE
jgi:3-deoxy-D-manno-octulosonate 8-phosphate phosphatase (KDO 8-P phosphatase)